MTRDEWWTTDPADAETCSHGEFGERCGRCAEDDEPNYEEEDDE